MAFWATPRHDFQLSHQFLDCCFAQLAAFYRLNNNTSTDHFHSVFTDWFFFEDTADIYALTLESLQARYVPVEADPFSTPRSSTNQE